MEKERDILLFWLARQGKLLSSALASSSSTEICQPAPRPMPIKYRRSWLIRFRRLARCRTDDDFNRNKFSVSQYKWARRCINIIVLLANNQMCRDRMPVGPDLLLVTCSPNNISEVLPTPRAPGEVTLLTSRAPGGRGRQQRNTVS
jgi:hypothetical protein